MPHELFAEKPFISAHRAGEEEKHAFRRLQNSFASQYQQIFHDKLAPRCVVIIPSLTLDQEILKRVKGHFYYEERMLCLLMLLQMPRTHITFVTSVPIDPVIVDYYLHLLPGITGYHARQRLTLLSCFDGSPKSLTEKVLERPRLIERIRSSIPAGHPAHIAFFNITNHERSLAVQLGLPIYGTDPDLNYLGAKSGSRNIFKACSIAMPDGFEHVKNETEVIYYLTLLKQRNPDLIRAVVKLNEGFSGEGNAVFSYEGAPEDSTLQEWIAAHLPLRLAIIAERLHYDTFFEKLESMKGIVEAFVEGKEKASPSIQCRINPLGKVDILSTHDQVLDAESGQIFLGATFPANREYAGDLGAIGLKAGEELKRHGALGRFGIDLISVKENNVWKHYAIEINLRKGGTTHPYLMLQFLTDGVYDTATGAYRMHDEKERFYFATDNLQRDCYKGLTPHDLIDIAMCNGLHYNGATEEGVVFHLISALSQYGKLGLVSIASTPERARAFYNKVVDVLNMECREQD